MYRYNTLEPERNLKGQAILILFQHPNIVPASQATGPLLVRRSMRKINKKTHLTKAVWQNESFARAMIFLDECLKVEERAGRYLPSIGFYSLRSTGQENLL